MERWNTWNGWNKIVIETASDEEKPLHTADALCYNSFMNSDLLNRITSNPRQCGGRPCIRGMRIRVKDVLDMLAGGATEAEILADYPYLEPDDIRASLEYAAAQIDHAVVLAA